MALFSGFLIGVFGSLHCVGMCGPLVLSLPLSKKDKASIAVKSLVYNLGRTLTYAIFGFIMGFLGWGLELGGLQKIFSILLGLILLYSCLTYVIPSLQLKTSVSQYINFNTIIQKVKRHFVINTNSNAIKLGMLNGLLPCGLVYVALASSVTQASPLLSSAYMLSFGLGTLPLMFLVMVGGNLYKNAFKKLNKFIPLMIGILGLYLIYRGMSLHIAENPDDIVKGIVKMSCH